MSTTTSYSPRDYIRLCDQCGVPFNRSRLHRKGPWIYCDTCDQPGDRIREQEDAAIARQRPFRILPVPNAKPRDFANANPYDYQREEAAVFNFIAATAPANTVGGALSPVGAAWAAIYMSDVITQNTRPPAWLATAQVVLRTCVNYLLTQQYGSPTGISPGGSVTDPRYGGILQSPNYVTANTVAAGIAFVKASAALGDPSLLNAADRVATFVRHSQCGDLQVTRWTEFPIGGSPYHVGGVGQVVSAAPLLSPTFQLADAGAALWFLSLLSVSRGTGAVYGDTAATAFFSAATAAPLSRMISELTAFLVTGPFDQSAGSVNVTGLSTTKPQATYSASEHGIGGTASWVASGTIAMSPIALATQGLFQATGASAQVILVMNWLAAFTANPANATPTTNTPQQTLDGITGVYSPATAPATLLQASAPFTDAAGALYNLASLGILAPVLASTNVASLRASRATVSPSVPYSTYQVDGKYLGPLGRAGLSLQPHSSAGASTPSVVAAAQFGAVYRYAMPGGYGLAAVPS